MGDPGPRPPADEPLTPAAASRRALAAAEAADPATWVRRHPARTLVLALAAGLLAARLPATRLAPFLIPLLSRPQFATLFLKALAIARRR